MQTVTLVNMKPGKKGTIVRIDGGSSLEKRLGVMGLGVGKHLTKLSAFVLRGPVAVRAGRTVVALGHSMAVKIWIQLEKI